MALIEVHELTKVFPNPDGSEKTAVDHISFKVHAGAIYGLLGPNGAGKTTALRMISGLLSATSGSVIMDGHNVTNRPEAAKSRIGYLTANTGLYARLTTREVLRYFGVLYNLPHDRIRARTAELTEWLGMGEFLDLRCGALSTGQRQRANIARAMIADPPILIMDEPTLGLDVMSNRVILGLIESQKKAGKA
ncbi:MAG: ATP-binding cassette domain-containing protein, partial [Phycisphaerales bacterium]|nr:ATP-binding cassette domain-containing protein [Phycisphaerales bacterium]